MTAVDPDVIKSLLIQTAGYLAERGWDQPNQLIILQWRGDKIGVSLLEKPLPETMDPEQFLFWLAQIATEKPEMIHKAMGSLAGICGLAVTETGQMTPGLTAEELAGYHCPEELRHHPDLKPGRLITLIDFEARVFFAHHIKGNEPWVSIAGDRESDEVHGGATEGLRQVMIAMLVAMPPTKERAEAIKNLSEMWTDTLEDVKTRVQFRNQENKKP